MMDPVEAINALKVYKERMKFVDKAMEALEASAEATMNADNAVKKLKKENAEVSMQLSTAKKDLEHTRNELKIAERDLATRLAKSAISYEEHKVEIQEKFKTLEINLRDAHEKRQREAEAEYASLSAEVVSLNEKVAAARIELKTVTEARNKLLRELGISNG